jgi:Zn-finger nucleic acid-binding protein
MSIQVTCPNGHDLHVKEKFAGQLGLCPKCQARVLVPAPLKGVSEDAILDMLGPPPAPPPKVEDLPVHQDPRHRTGEVDPAATPGSSLWGSKLLHRGMKVCPKCRREVRLAYDLCPHCRTYFTDLAEIARRIVVPCKQCGKETHLGDKSCAHCGVDLRVK